MSGGRQMPMATPWISSRRSTGQNRSKPIRLLLF